MKTLVAWILVATFVLGGIAVAYAPDEDPDIRPLRFGMDSASLNAQAQSGVKPDYGTLWVGPWTLKSGWGGPGDAMSTMRERGVTPAIHFYYWGDDISASCVEDGCWSDLHDVHKNREGWKRLADELVANLHDRMDGDPVLVFMETEFNKNGIDNHGPFDGYLAQMSRHIATGYPAAKIVMALGNWNRGSWSAFGESAEASDYVGIQGMRASTRDSLSGYRSIYEDTVHGVEHLQGLFGKPVILLDIALSSYPEPDYLRHQAETLEGFFTGVERLQDAGVEGIFYRGWYDHPGKDVNNYYGVAERHWGLKWDPFSALKPAGEVWVAGVQAARNGEPYESPLTWERDFEVHFDLSSGIGQWWVETYASGSNPLEKVLARVDDGKWHALKYTDWGSWAASFHAPRGSQMVFKAMDAQGNEASTFPFTWMQEDPRMDDSAKHPARALFASSQDDLHVVYNASASSDRYDRDLTYEWDLGDGTTATGDTVEHTYNATGSYHVTLTVDNGDLTNSTTTTIHVEAPPPVASFTGNTDGLTARFDASASHDPHGRELSYTWDLGDGSTASGESLGHTYNKSRDYTVTLTVHNGESTNTTRDTIHVEAPAPTAAFNVTRDGLHVFLDGSASGDRHDRDLTFEWDLGDGTTRTGETAEHAYGASGTYTVTLHVDNGEKTNTTDRNLVVEAPAPVAAFEASEDGLRVHLDASGSYDPSGRPLAHEWQLGDGTTLTGHEVEHTYTTPGRYAVTLNVSNGERWNETQQLVDVERTAPPLAADYRLGSNVNEWWVEVYVDANKPLARVQARVDDGPWRTLSPTDWGSWAASFHVPPGSDVVFRATDDDGQRALSQPFPWMQEQTEPEQPALEARFDPSSGVNNWWVEVYVDANNPLARVQARVDDGAWRTLSPTDWGSWAASFHVKTGSEVVFRATDEDGQRALSGPYTWP